MANLPANSSIRRKPQHPARCSSSKSKQTALRTAEQLANGFLKHRFLPLYEAGEGLPPKGQVESSFFRSMAIAEKRHGIGVIDVADQPYPYNILLAHWDAARQLDEVIKDNDLSIVTDEKNHVQLLSKEICDTGTRLYYIPVLPLYRLLQDKKQKHTAELLLSVFAYLYHVADVPYYRNEDTFMFCNYEIMEQWLEDDWQGLDEDDVKRNRSELNASFYYGDIMQRKMFNPYQLNHFRERTEKYKPCNELEKECLLTARKALSLFEQYADRNIYQHILNEEQEDEDYQSIGIHEYMSFIAGNNGDLYQSLSEMVNSDFNERATLNEPVLQTLYTKAAENITDSLDFERRIFSLLEDLCTVLNELV